MIQETIARLLENVDLTRAEACEAMQEIMRGDATQAQIAGFLVALRAKGETAEEITGCAEAMRDHVLPVHPLRSDLVDTAGTGGDGKRTLNISTAAALLAAAFSSTASRRAPPSPASTDRIASAFSPAAPPRSSAGSLRSRPSSCGSTVHFRTAPSRTS